MIERARKRLDKRAKRGISRLARSQLSRSMAQTKPGDQASVGIVPGEEPR